MRVTPATIGKHIYDTLTQDSAVAAIVGTKVFPHTTSAPENLPWVVYTDMAVNYAATKDAAEPDSASCRVVCATSTYEAAVVLGDAVAAALNDNSGMRVGSVVSGYDLDLGFITEINLITELI